MKLKTVHLMAGVCLLLITRPALADSNLVVNGDFGAPGFIAWDPGPSTDGSAYYEVDDPNSPVPDWTMSPVPGQGQSCASQASAFCYDAGVDYEDLPLNGENTFVIDTNSVMGSLSQNLTTTSGTEYELTYWLELFNFNFDPVTGSFVPILSVPPDNAFSVSWDGTPIGGSILSNAKPFGWTEYSFLVTGTESDTLNFSGFSDDGELAYSLADISVTPVPEPATLVLLGTGLLGAELRRLKSRKA